MKKKLKIFSIIFLGLTILSLAYFISDVYANESIEKKIEYYQKSFYDELNDGWVAYFEIDYPLNKEQNVYMFDAFNMKYKKLDGYYVPVIDNQTNKELYRVTPDYITLSISEKYGNDIHNINAFFNEKQFNKNITIDDLKDLNVIDIDKKYLVETFNKAINSKIKNTPGKYLNSCFLGKINVASSEKNLNGEWQLTYIINYGNIEKIDIEFINEQGQNISDEVLDKENLLKKIKQIENDIIVNQSINNDILNINFDSKQINTDLNKLLNQFKNELN